MAKNRDGIPERSGEVNGINHGGHNGKGGGKVGTLVMGSIVHIIQMIMIPIMMLMMVVNGKYLSWIFDMLEDKVYSKDVHVLEDSPNPNPPSHRKVSAHHRVLLQFP